MAEISLLIPIYNSSKYLRQCLESVLSQSFRDMEIICVNDGSTDDSLLILKEYAIRDSRIRIIDKENTGYGNSLNIAIEAAIGKYIAVVESDDFIDEMMMETLYVIAEKNGAEVVKSNLYYYKKETGSVFYEMLMPCPYGEVFVPSDIPKIFFGEIFLWTGIYQKNFLIENAIRFNETPGASYQDVGFTFKVYMAARKMIAIKEAFYHYRLDNELSSIHSKKKVYCICDEFKEIWRYLSIRKDAFKKLKLVVPYMQYKRYMPTYGRIASKFKLSFMKKMIEEFDSMSSRKLLDERYWEPVDWENVNSLNKIYMSEYARQQNSIWILNGFLSSLSRTNCIYIYGAGKIGKEVFKNLKIHGINIKAFVVTDNYSKEVDGVPVYAIDELDDVHEATFIISVKADTQFEIYCNLKERHAKQVISVDYYLRQALKDESNI